VVRSPAITRTVGWLRQLVKELVSNGNGRHKSWLQQLEPESPEILRVELVTSYLTAKQRVTVPVRVSIRAEQQSLREELQLQ
jgi:hypothetical protein